MKVTKTLPRVSSNLYLGNIESNSINLQGLQDLEGDYASSGVTLSLDKESSSIDQFWIFPNHRQWRILPHLDLQPWRFWTEINHGMLRKKVASNCKKLPVTSTPFSWCNHISSSPESMKTDESMSGNEIKMLPDFGINGRTITNIFSFLLFFGAVVTSLRLSHLLSLPTDWFW